MWAHGTEPPRCLAARTGPSVGNCGAGRPVGGYSGMRAIDGIAPCSVVTRSACMVASLVMSQQAIAGLMDSEGLPAGRDWRRRRTDQPRDLVSG
jgi:hypothetical protein